MRQFTDTAGRTPVAGVALYVSIGGYVDLKNHCKFLIKTAIV